jgi:heme oxygenase
VSSVVAAGARDALSVLREATRALHDAVESAALPRRLMSGRVTLDDYRAFLQAHRPITEAWASRCPAAVRRASGCDPESRLRALHADLAALAGAPSEGAPPPVAQAQDAASFLWPDDAAEWWGALYVVEGSRLGGRVVARHLRERLGRAAPPAFAYLDGDAAGNAAAWPVTIRRLQAALPPPRHAAAVRGALATFQRFHAALG